MKQFARLPGLLLALALFVPGLPATEIQPVTPDASPEARALLQMLQDISGKYTLTGQHNFPNVKGRNSEFAAKYIGKTPVIFGTDMGFAKEGDTDSYLARPDIVQEAIAQHRRGAIVALCWHAVPPTADEPVTFRPLPGSDPKSLASVQGRLLDDQFKDVLTPGTPLYEKWCRQVDAVAVYLKQLQDAHVPVLWRPYHEMNGDWFWWGGRTGEYSTMALYKQIFDRLVHHHHLNNLIWVWSVDRVHNAQMAYPNYFPGPDFVDVLALDVYGSDFAQSYYDSLVALSQGKPLALAEVGNPPSPGILEQQPRWTYYMTWAGMVRNTTRKQYHALRQDPRILNLEDPAYAGAVAGLRQASGLPPVHIIPPPADFSGSWVLDEDKSTFGRLGAGAAPARMDIVQNGADLAVKSTQIVEYADNRITEETYRLDGTETKSEFMNSPRLTTAHLTADGAAIVMNSTIALKFGPPGARLTTTETWKLGDGDRELTLDSESKSPMGEQHTVLVFDRR